MAQLSNKDYVLVVLGIGSLLQLLLALVYWNLVEPYWTWRQYRVVEITRFPSLIRRALVDGYIANTVAKQTKPLVLVMGDSEPYGAFVEERLTFSHLLAQHLPNYAVFNISFKGGQFSDIEKVLDSLERYHVHPEMIIFDVDFAHFRVPGDTQSDGYGVLPSAFVPIYLAIGAATLPDVRRVYEFSSQSPDLRPDTFNYIPLSRDSLSSDPSPESDESFKHVLRRTTRVSKNVVAYIPPFAIESFKHYGFDDVAFKRVAAHYVGICKNLGVDCLDLSSALPMNNFLDVIHLNGQGHAFMAQRLEQAITRQFREISAAPATGHSGIIGTQTPPYP
jgi:hypothetical protein